MIKCASIAFVTLHMNVIVMVRIGNHVWEIVLLDNLGGWGVPARKGAPSRAQ